MAHSPTYEVRIRHEIRNALAIDPIATIPELTERLNKRLSHSFDPRYIKKLTDKVAHQLIVESDRLRIESVCAVHLAGPSNAGIGTDQQRRPCIDGNATYAYWLQRAGKPSDWPDEACRSSVRTNVENSANAARLSKRKEYERR